MLDGMEANPSWTEPQCEEMLSLRPPHGPLRSFSFIYVFLYYSLLSRSLKKCDQSHAVFHQGPHDIACRSKANMTVVPVRHHRRIKTPLFICLFLPGQVSSSSTYLHLPT
ncbi:hypothetical protein LZ32DRAFT_271024 [Colletotrichum eremochloae]|nr:hypothetical protein LZ32DRAFT_271024 [Colletotrichum eremochloae]